MVKSAKRALLLTVYPRYWPVIVDGHVGMVRVV
jgi:hypothetical protein